MKNEIGRKITSLTIMAVMFTGLGLVQGVPSFMPGAFADNSNSATEGMLSVSTTTLQGAAILEIVINDPDISDTTNDIASTPTIEIDGVSHETQQAVNGKWYLYLVDLSQSELVDADGKGMEFGIKCTTGLGINTGPVDNADKVRGTANIISTGTTVWAEALATSGTTASQSGGCLDINNMIASLDTTAGTTSRQLLSAAMLTGAPSLSNWNGVTGNDSSVDLGQRGHSLNTTSGYGSWPYILAQDLNSEFEVAYGADTIAVEYGNTDDETSISILNQSPADAHHIHLTIADPALNMDPTGIDTWIFDAAASAASGHSIVFANNGSNSHGHQARAAITVAEQGDLGFVDNGRLFNDTASAKKYLDGITHIEMVETGSNTATFESWSANGTSQITTKLHAGADGKVVFSYGGDYADIVITYNNAVLEFVDDNGGDWNPTESATVRVTDPDANRQPGSAEDLEISDETVVIPTIKMGSPLTLGGGGVSCQETTSAQCNTSVNLPFNNTSVRIGTDCVGSAEGCVNYHGYVTNVTDSSERLSIILTGQSNGYDPQGTAWTPVTSISEFTGGSNHDHTWVNVTTSHARSALINLPGTPVLSYNVEGPASSLSSTAVAVYITDASSNSTNNAAGELGVVTTGNARSGVVDLDDGTQQVRNADVSVASFSGTGQADTGLLGINFKITHPVGNFFNNTEDFAISADICNFDQDNGSYVHNCIYRIEASETGKNTGVFEGSAEYILLNNSTSLDSDNGEHDGNDEEVENLVGVDSSDVTIVLNSGVSGVDSPRVTYNDTDAAQVADKLGEELDTLSQSGTADLDLDSYGEADMATITIVDSDLNQDSSIRDTYENSSRTFQMNITKADGTAQMPFTNKPMTIIETGPSTGVFVGTFTVPSNYLGSSMDLTYYDSLNEAGNADEATDGAVIESNSGSITLDKSVYPVPFDANDLRTGANAGTGQSEGGNVTAWITVTDTDFTDDTMTTSSIGTAGTILVKIIEGSTTHTCFTAGSAATISADGSTNQDVGPLSEIDRGSSSYEVSVNIDQTQHCGSTASPVTVTSGDVLQVEYVDAANDAGSSVTVYDSSTFDLRTATLSVDKDVYVLGSDMVVTLTDPDLNLDSTSTDSYALSILEWDSAADSSELLNNSGYSGTNFVSVPASLQETGDDTGVFQVVITLPSSGLYPGGDPSGTIATIEAGEDVTLTYVDVGLSGEDNTEDDVLDIEAYFSISNFGALIELDKDVYNWTDTVYITITAPDHNNDSGAEEQIGTSSLPITVSTRSGKMCNGASTDKTYYADESGGDTGVFEAEVQLTGFNHTMSSDSDTRTATATTTSCSTSDGGNLKTSSQTDGVSVSYEYTDGSVVFASAAIVWNIGEASFDTSSASAGGSAVFTVVDADENVDDTITDTFTVSVFSDSDSGGLTLTMNETDENTGVFEGTVFFTSDLGTSGTNLRVSEGDTVTAEYTDETLPEPYTTSDDLTIAGTLTIGTAYPPLERAPAANARVVDAFGSSVAEVTVDQQVQIAADVSNGQSKDQAFAYLVQVQDGDGVTVSLAWITGSLTAGQSMSPALSWTPSEAGSYTATVFVWESVDNPTALSPTVSVDIDVV